MEQVDVLVIGGGMAGASAAYELAATRKVVVLERETQPGYHTTGRSAALYTQTYGPPPVRALTVASWDFYTHPPAGFTDMPLLTPRGVLLVGRSDQEADLEQALEEGRRFTSTLRRLDGAAAVEHAPVLRADYVAGAVDEPDAMDIDVHALLHGYLRGLKARGGRLVTGAEVTGLTRTVGLWQVKTNAGTFAAPVLINAAGAWCDVVARMAGVTPIGLVPKRRTAVLVDPVTDSPAVSQGVNGWPMVIDVTDTFYAKPDAGRVMLSPADETPMEPCDVQPDELDIAIAVDRVEKATRLTVRRVAHAWAGLRSFVADKVPVAGFDPRAEGFFWLAGQGGYGIQTAPAMGRSVASLVTAGTLPADVAALGVTPQDLSPARLRS